MISSLLKNHKAITKQAEKAKKKKAMYEVLKRGRTQ
jgi:hypothetical protein